MEILVKISEITVDSTELRMTEEIATGAGVLGDRSGVRLMLRTNDGLVGNGESAPIPGMLNPGGLEALARDIRGWVAGAKGKEVDDLLDSLDARSLAPLARFAVHSALIDLVGQASGVPLYQWLRAASSPAVHVNALVADESPAEVHAAVLRATGEGASAVKLKVAMGEPARDVTRIIAASEAAGPNVELRLDANGAWDLKTAVHVVDRVGQYRLGYVEDPTRHVDDLAAFAEATGVAVAVDAEPGHAEDLVQFVERSGADVLVIKPAAAGGVDRVVDAARRLGGDHRVVVSSSIDGEVSLLAALHAAASLPGDEVHGLATAHLVSGVPESLRPVGGQILLRDGGGLGLGQY